eukprot:TRINITY_DN75621_c0_g1_i1.p2 TRINITY_DN75621_c0_g1~~TRINITY_DN75621_c0_g1_i1.p2  ORF type:complete len:272 (+),score=84.89 TRINITY_DN75621_c0_g1_i1:78-893(+)
MTSMTAIMHRIAAKSSLMRLPLSLSRASSVMAAQRMSIATMAVRRPLNMLVVGPPGVGKGTYAKLLLPKLGVVHVSSGDMLRAMAKRGEGDVERIARCLERGEMLDDELMTPLMEERLAQPDVRERGVLLDGYPRNVAQVGILDRMLDVHFVLQLDLRRDIMIAKTVARRVCSGCGKGYNLADINEDGIVMPPILPKTPGVCDDCQGELVSRPDDTEEIAKQRLALYDKVTEPLLHEYRQRGIVHRFELTGGVAEMEQPLTELVLEHTTIK